VGTCLAYVTAILLGQRVMKTRSPIKATAFTYCHNMLLCVWSLAMVVGAFLEGYRLYADNGVEVIFCDIKGLTYMGRMNWWMYIFYISKYYELIDTML
jgi:fatty acid elongase 3